MTGPAMPKKRENWILTSRSMPKALLTVSVTASGYESG